MQDCKRRLAEGAWTLPASEPHQLRNAREREDAALVAQLDNDQCLLARGERSGREEPSRKPAGPP